MSEHILEYLCENNPNSIILIDESYSDFSGKTYLDYFFKYDNIILCRSFSKIQMAGVRIGYGIAKPEYVSLLEEILLIPYNLNLFQLLTIKNYGLIKPGVEKIAHEVQIERERFYDFFKKAGVRFQKSHGNFILFEVEEPDSIYEALLKALIKVRNVSRLAGLNRSLRVTVRSPEENDLFFQNMTALLEIPVT